MRKKIYLPVRFFTLAISFLASVVFVNNALLSQPVLATTSGSWWNAGHIIDDQVFYNKDSMTVAQIQQFLNAKVPTCDNMGAEQYGGTGKTVYQYFHPLGYKFPVTCLKDYFENPNNNQNNLTQTDGQAAPVPTGAISSAQIIWNIAQQYTINPQVLLVTMQKEQGLVADDSPLSVQYQHTMGYSCWFSNCQSQYDGFYKQVAAAAWQYRQYATNPNDYNYVVGSGNNILYNETNSGCGAGGVTILNQATASLYDYDPFQPNQAALNNLYGSGDSCSAYGNRNFWRDFYDWFGSPLVSFVWQNQGYRVMDQTGTTYLDPGKLLPGQQYVAVLSALNTGTAIWSNSGPTPFTLATEGNSGTLYTPGWLAANRPTYLQETNITPGQVGHFRFTFRAPLGLGYYANYFRPVAEFLTWSNDTSEPLGITVNPGTYSWASQGFQVWDKGNATRLDPGQLSPGQIYTIKLVALNTGTATWTNTDPTPVTLAPDNPAGHNSFLCNTNWLACNRAAYLHETSVAPGQTGTFTFTIQAPYTPGAYREYFRPLSEFVSWINGNSDSLGIVVQSPGTYQWQNLGYRVLDQTETNYLDPGQLQAGQKYIIKLAALNTGTATWTNNGPSPVTLGTTNPQSHSSFLCYSSWLACNRPVYLQENSVAPGQIGSFKFMIQAPASPGAYREYFTPVAEFLSWFPDSSESLGIVVH